MEHQLLILQDKREKGLQEIQKLTKTIESLRSGKPLPVNGNDINTKTQSAQPSSHNKILPMSGPNNAIDKQDVLNQIQEIRQHLELLYKEVIITLSDQKILEASLELKGIPKFSDSLIKIEKKINDIILIVREYIETLE